MKTSLRNHRRFCTVFQKLKEKMLLDENKNKKYSCIVCNKGYNRKSDLTKHYCDINDFNHNKFIEEQIEIAIVEFKENKNIREIIDENKFILGKKKLLKIWRNNFDINKVNIEIYKKKYKKKIFKCLKCGNNFIQRRSFGICFDCKNKKYNENRKKRNEINKKFNCKICDKKIGITKSGVCQNCLRHTDEGKLILSKMYKGINKGNPGWARVKTKNNYIENRVVTKLIKNNFNIICQKQIKRFRVDIFLIDYNIIVECDGKQHYRNKYNFDKDKKRDKELIKLEYRIIRFNAYFIQLLINDVLMKINKFVNKKKNREINYCDENGKKLKGI